MEKQGVKVSRTKTVEINFYNPKSIGASYSWVKSLKNVIGPDTERIVMYHARLTNLDGFENSKLIQQAYLGFNLIHEFQKKDSELKNIETLDLVGNPIKSLINCPPCKELIVSSTCIENLKGCPESVKILRIGHSTHLKSLQGCPSNVEIIECSCTPNLIIEKEYLPKNLQEFHKDGELVQF